MSAAKMGAMVQYCGHDGCFVADIRRVGNVNVVIANGPVTPDNIRRPAEKHKPTHHLEDFPEGGYWAPHKGIFVVPEDQVTALQKEEQPAAMPGVKPVAMVKPRMERPLRRSVVTGLKMLDTGLPLGMKAKIVADIVDKMQKTKKRGLKK